MNKEIAFIELLGGCTKVAGYCGIGRSAVSQWKKKGIPKAQLNYLSTRFKKEYQKAFS